MIDTPDGLQALAESLLHVERIGLDVEGDGLYRYRSRLCTIQVAAGDTIAVIDSLAIEDLSALVPVLDEAGPKKILHDVSFDRKMLAERGLPLGHVFDTSVAARFFSEPSTGLAAILEKYFEVTLNKKYQQADWGERPLDEDRLAYLTADVRHLPALADRFEARAAELDLLEEIDEEARYAMERAVMPEKEWEPWTRVKGVRELGPRGQALVKALSDVREEEAQRRDVPPFRVAANRVLFEAARRRSTKLRDLRKIRGLSKMPDDLLDEALRRAERDGPPVEPPREPRPSAADRKARKAREKALTDWRAAEAERRTVDVQAVLPGHCVRELSGQAEVDLASVAGLGRKRIERYGEMLRSLITPGD